MPLLANGVTWAPELYPPISKTITAKLNCGIILPAASSARTCNFADSKAGINTMFNTATVVGVGVNIHGAGFPRNFVASFSEGGTAGFTDVQLTKFYAIAEKMMARRGRTLTDADKTIFEAIYNQAEQLK